MPQTKRGPSKVPAAEREKRPLHQYEHTGKQRTNNPPVGLVDAKSDPVEGKKTYAYDPHLDPTLVWAGKAERTSFEVPTVSLHVHERIDPRSIIEAVRKKNGSDYEQLSLFNSKTENPPLREAIEFYKHAHNWTNRVVAGDSALVMNSMIEKEGMAGQVQMIYFDPPYGIKYGSNFQPFVNKREVKDGKDEDLTAEPEQVRAFRDTWELGLHSYLSCLRDRLFLAQESLSESGSIFVQISDENVHHVREILDEVFGTQNFCGIIPFKKTSGQSSTLLANIFDFAVWYAKNREQTKFRMLYERKEPREQIGIFYDHVELANGTRRRMTTEEVETLTVPEGAKVFQGSVLYSEGATEHGGYPIRLDGDEYVPPPNTHWKTNADGMKRLLASKRVFLLRNLSRHHRRRQYTVTHGFYTFNQKFLLAFLVLLSTF
jgi:adenine-specific DNA-methyltransferase